MRCNTLLFFILVCCFLSSCASTRGTSDSKKENSATKNYSNEEIEEINEKVSTNFDLRLGKLAELVKKAGDDKVNLFVTEWYLKASASMYEADYQTANLIFKNLIKLVPNDAYIRRRYARSLIRTGDLKESEVILKEVFKGKQATVQDGLILGGIYSSLGELGAARTTYTKVMKMDSKNEDACLFLGKSYALEDQPAKAIKYLEGCEKRIKKNGIFSYYIAKIWVEKNDFKKATKYFARAKSIQPDLTEATLALGLIYENDKKHTQAIKMYKNYIAENPRDVAVLTRLVQLYFSMEKFDEVIPYAEKLSDMESENLNLKIKLGILYTDAKRYNDAISIFKDLLIHAPDNDRLLYYVGAIYQEIKEYEKAIEYYTQIEPNSGLYNDSVLQMANMLSSLALPGEAPSKVSASWGIKLEKFVAKQIEQREPLKVNLTLIYANYLEGVGRLDEAVVALKEISTHKEFNNRNRYYLAALLEKRSRSSEAAEIIFDILKESPEDAHAWNFVGYSILEKGGSYDLAREYILKALALRPNDGYIRDSLGWYYYKIGDTERALKELEYAAQVVKDDPSILKHLAIVFTARKNFTKAAFWLRKVIPQIADLNEKNELETALQSLQSNRAPANFE